MSIVWPTKLHSSLYFEWQARGELEQPLSHSHRGGESQYLPPFFFLFTIFFGRQQHEYLCPFTGPMECGNQPPTAVTSAEWKTLSSMTHRVRWHTSTGCLIVRLRSVSTWPERLSAVRWVEETLLPLIRLAGWILRSLDQGGSLWVNTPAQFYSRGEFVTVDAGGLCSAPNTQLLEWHLEGKNEPECGLRCVSVSFLSFWGSIFVVSAMAFVQASKQHDLTSEFYCNVSLWQVYSWKKGRRNKEHRPTVYLERLKQRMNSVNFDLFTLHLDFCNS